MESCPVTPELLANPIPVPAETLSSGPFPKLKITYILGSLRDGGTERQALELMRALDRTRFEPSLILMENANPERAREVVDQCLVMGIPQAGNSSWFRRSLVLTRAVYTTRKCLQQMRSDVVHAFLPAACILGGLAARLAGVPLILGSRRSMPSQYRRKSRVGAWADTAAFRLAHYNLSNSRAVGREMVDVAGCPASRCGTIYNGVDLQRFHPAITSELRRQLGWMNGEVVFGMVANFRPCKRHYDFLEAAALLAARHNEARFLMAGADHGEKAAVEEQIAARSLGGKVRILESTPFPETILAAIDVCVCTSEAEGFSNVLLEAMACGKPVIATRVGGNTEAVRDRETGILVSPRDLCSTAEASAALLQDPGLRRAMGLAGRKRVEQEFSVSEMVRRHEELYLNLWRQYGSVVAQRFSSRVRTT
jgi:L-malate glycosyltransferase